MTILQFLFVDHWLSSLLMLIGIGILVTAWVGRKRDNFAKHLSLVAILVFGLAFGSFDQIPGDWNFWLTIGGGSALLLLFILLCLSSQWSAWFGLPAGVVFFFGLGGLFLPELQTSLEASAKFVVSLRPQKPWWLVLLIAIPLVLWISHSSLTSLGKTRKLLVQAFRTSAILLLVLALAETQARKQYENQTILFLWDRSESIPSEMVDGKDERENRILDFINKAVDRRGPQHAQDQIGLIVFGRYPRLELPPAKLPRRLGLQGIASQVDGTATDIESALSLAMSSFPENTNKRIVLISDGNENLGRISKQATFAKQNGVQIDVVPLAASRPNQSEILVERVETPTNVLQDSRVKVTVLIRNNHPQPVRGLLSLIKTTAKMVEVGGQFQTIFSSETMKEITVDVPTGLQPISFTVPSGKLEDSYVYEARFVPENLPGDRLENNRASATIVARGHGAVLLIEPRIGDHSLLVSRLRKIKSGLKVVSIVPEQLPLEGEKLGLLLSKFDSVILANVPAEQFTEEQQKIFRSNTQDQGSGLVMIGGPQSFGAGGWQGTEVEKALPVRCDLKSLEVEGKSGLVLIMHASELREGVTLQKKVAKLAVEKLGQQDMVGILVYDFVNGTQWHVPFTQVGKNRAGILRLVDTMSPGDMMDAKPSFQMAYKELMNKDYQLGTKHIIFISDGDHWNQPANAPNAELAKLKQAKITCSTVCITTHGQGEYDSMAEVAKKTGGRWYPKRGPDGVYRPIPNNQLPQIYMKETRLISKSFLYTKKFQPDLLFRAGPTKGLPELPPLYGFVRTQLRDSPLVQSPIVSPKIGKDIFPILAHWQYGLGKSVAFTSDARTKPGVNVEPNPWDVDWASSGIYGPFWEQLVEWSLRAVESGRNLTIRSLEQANGKLRILVDAKNDNNIPIPNVDFVAGVTSPKLGKTETRIEKFVQIEPGVYEAEIPAEEKGAYFFNIRGKWPDANGGLQQDSVRGGLTIKYSPEYSETSSNVNLLRELASQTGGRVYGESPKVFDRVTRNAELFREFSQAGASQQPIWYWLVFAAGLSLFMDIAIRRIAIEPQKMLEKLQIGWFWLRAIPLTRPKEPEFIQRLGEVKQTIAATMTKEKASRKFSAEGKPQSTIPGAELPATPSKSEPEKKPTGKTPVLAPEEENAAPEDFASRLMRAKKKVWKDKNKENDKE